MGAIGDAAREGGVGVGGDPPFGVGHRATLSKIDLNQLITLLRGDGFTVVGPAVRDGAIGFSEIRGTDDLPEGWTESQEAGRYRLSRREDGALFGYSVGPQSLKHLFFVPRVRLVELRRKDGSFSRTDAAPELPRLAVIGARACDLAAVDVQDRVFADGPYVDPDYVGRRRGLFVIAVQCGQAGGTCFCVSMRTGPRVTHGFDLAMTEILEGEHRFVVEVGSASGAALLSRVTAPRTEPEDVAKADAIVERTAGQMGRSLDTDGIKDLFYRNLEHPRWDDVAARCLSCTNCTLVCPTCFCSTVEDTSDLRGDAAERWRRWDSCFTKDHSFIHGGSVHASIRTRYRQWLTHKLATWIDQYDTSGCVGCGRCITWCPVAIDITEETRAIRASDGARGGEP